MSKPIGSDWDIGLSCKKQITGYSALKIKYQKPLPEGGGDPETGFLNGEAYGSSNPLKIKATVPHSVWNTLGKWEFITWVEFGDGRVLKGEKPFSVVCDGEFDKACACST